MSTTPINTPDNTPCKCVKIQIQKKKMDKQTKKNLIIAGSVIGSVAVITAVTLGLVYGLKDCTKKDIKDKANTIIEEAKDSINNTIDNVKEKVEPIVQDAKDSIEEKKNQGNTLIDEARTNINEKKNQGVLLMEEAKEKIKSKIPDETVIKVDI